MINLAVTLGRSCLKRRWHGRGKRMISFRRCRKMKERQAEVYFRRNPEMLEFRMRREGLL